MAPWPGHYISAEGCYREGDTEAGAERRAAIFIGPEFGTVSRPDLVAAAREVNITVPLVVRLEGTNVQLGKDILANSGLPIVSADDLGDAARKIVAEVKQAA